LDLGEEFLLDNLSLDATGITFYEHLSKSALKGRQYILPHGDATFLAIQLPLPGKELPLQLDDHRMGRRRSPTPIKIVEIGVMTMKQAQASASTG
jgi:hypothetical protein